MGITAQQIGDRVRQLRKDRDMTTTELAEKSGLSSVRMIETGKQYGSIQGLSRLADVLGVKIGAFFRSRRHPKTGRKPDRIAKAG